VDVVYSLIMLTALILCGLLLRRSQGSLGLSGGQRAAIGWGAFCGAMIGAKLPFVFSDWEGLVSGAAWFAHGKTILGGLIGGYLGVELTKLLLDIRVKTGDSFAVPVAVAVGIGRLGCFRAGCCYGTPTTLPWGVVFPTALENPHLARHPTQLYEAAFHFSAAIVLWCLVRGGYFRGQLIKLYLISYLVYRFLTEFIRPEARLWYGLSGYQAATLLLIGLFVWLWIRDQRRFNSQRDTSLPEELATVRAIGANGSMAATGVTLHTNALRTIDHHRAAEPAPSAAAFDTVEPAPSSGAQDGTSTAGQSS
jgi:phosphatidylglycerol:prolipoprotein diacylglycerol transferase